MSVRQDTICLLENEPALARLIIVILGQENIDVVVCKSPEELSATVKTQGVGLSVLDVGMPPEPMLTFARELKANDEKTSVLATSANGGDIARLCIEAGADDYLAKPFDPDVLVECVDVLLDRPIAEIGTSAIFEGHSMRLDLSHRKLAVKGEEVRLSRTEWEILRILAVSAGQPVFTTDIARAAFGPDLMLDIAYLDLWMARLKTKIHSTGGDGGTLIRPFHDIGYTLEMTKSPNTSA